jgi:hypothetical protein
MRKIDYLKILDLTLDINNPRFGELYTGSNKEEDLIEYLLFNESAISVAEKLSVTKEFYVDKPLLVLRDGKRYIVKDGNRRCAAVKALLDPKKYGLTFSICELEKLPVVIYDDKLEIENRIIEEHTNNMFRKWDRIAKAIEVFRQFNSGSSIESMRDIDSEPAKLIKLASFYYTAVKIGGDRLRKLLRKGRGNTGGKTEIFVRLFKYADNCGYRFKNKPSFVVEITDKKRFKEYIKSIVDYLEKNPSTIYSDVDDKKPEFFQSIGLTMGVKNKIISNNFKKDKTISTKDNHQNISQIEPQYNRIIPGPLKKVIDECYDLDEINFTNSKIAMSRVVFECCLKYIVEETNFNDMPLKDYNYFRSAFYDKKGNKLKWTNFKELKKLFENLILNTGKSGAFKNFELEKPHQIIHNYNIAGLVNDSKNLNDNLIPLIEFMLESEQNLLNSIDLTKLI